MLQKDNILKELNELNSSLAGQDSKNPYQVPAGYFDGLSEQVLRRIRAMEAGDAVEELSVLSPLLSSLDKKMPFTVPAGYFEQLAVNSKKAEPAKVISFSSRKWFRYAVAAVVTGVVIMAGYFYMNDRKESGKQVMAKVTKDVKKMNETEQDKLMDFIDAGLSRRETVQVSPNNKTAIEKLLEDVSEEELKDLGEQTEDIGDILMTN